LLDSLGSAQIEQEVIMKVMPLVQQQLDNVKEETGIELSLIEEDVRRYMEHAIYADINIYKLRQVYFYSSLF